MDELFRAVDELTRPSQLRRECVDVRSGQPMRLVENFSGLSLMEELIDAIEPRGNKGGERGGNGSHLPIDAAAFDLWVEVSYDVHFWARDLSIDRGSYPGKEGVGPLLRSVSATAPGRWEDAQLDATAATCRTWAHKIRAMLHNQRSWRGVRGVECTDCQTTWILESRMEDGTMRTYREPALIVHTNPATGSIAYWMCRSCRTMTWPERAA